VIIEFLLLDFLQPLLSELFLLK